MNEVEFFKILDNPLVKSTAAHVKPFAKHGSRITAVATSTQDVGANRSERALAIWIAVLLRVYLHTRGAASGPLVEKVWKFAAGEADIDIRVGINGENHFFQSDHEYVRPNLVSATDLLMDQREEELRLGAVWIVSR